MAAQSADCARFPDCMEHIQVNFSPKLSPSTLTYIPRNAMPNIGSTYPSNSALAQMSIPRASFPRTTMYNAGSTYPNNCALTQMSIPPANMASAGIAATGMTTPPSTLTSSQMAMHLNAMWRYSYANQPSYVGHVALLHNISILH